jgi:heme A synthase
MNAGPEDAAAGKPALRSAFRWLATILVVAVVVQIGLAGYGAFHAVHAADHHSISKKTIENAFSAHVALGYIIVLVMIVLLVVAVAGRLGKRAIVGAGVIVLLGVLQAILGIVSESTPAIGPLHTINALAIAGSAGGLTGRAWRAKRAAGRASS